MISALDICNNALDRIGQGSRIASLSEQSPEAEACARWYPITYASALEAYNWSFARRDEILTSDDLLADFNPIPYKYAYKIPNDLMKILYITRPNVGEYVETLGNRTGVSFNFRSQDGVKVIACSSPPPLVIHYQANLDPINDIELCTPAFANALSILLASNIVGSLVRDVTSASVSLELYKLGSAFLAQAASYDANQGGYTVSNNKYSSFLLARR